MAGNTHYTNRQIANAIKGNTQTNVTKGTVLSVERFSRTAIVSIGGSPGVKLDIITQELADQLDTLYKSGAKPTVKIEQDVVIAYNGRMPVYERAKGILMPRVMGFYAHIVPLTETGSLGSRQEPMVISNILDVRGNVETAPTADLGLDIQISYDATPAGTWTSIFSTTPVIAAGSNVMTFGGGPFVPETHLASPTIDGPQYTRMVRLSGGEDTVIKLTVQILLIAELFVE
jgi:hypothetical protein